MRGGSNKMWLSLWSSVKYNCSRLLVLSRTHLKKLFLSCAEFKKKTSIQHARIICRMIFTPVDCLFVQVWSFTLSYYLACVWVSVCLCEFVCLHWCVDMLLFLFMCWWQPDLNLTLWSGPCEACTGAFWENKTSHQLTLSHLSVTRQEVICMLLFVCCVVLCVFP